MKQFSILATCLSLLTATPAIAQSAQVISLGAARSGGQAIPVAVHAGYGVNISYLGTGETIELVILDNPARYSLTLDEQLCASGGRCQAGLTQLIHLRLMQGIQFPNLTTAAGNRTLLTVKTRDRNNQSHLYVFHLMPGKGMPKYHTLTLTPAREAAPESAQLAGTRNLIDLANVSQGIARAQAERRLPDNPELWKRIYTFMTYVRQGLPYVEAVRKAGISLALIHKLEAWGRDK